MNAWLCCWDRRGFALHAIVCFFNEKRRAVTQNVAKILSLPNKSSSAMPRLYKIPSKTHLKLSQQVARNPTLGATRPYWICVSEKHLAGSPECRPERWGWEAGAPLQHRFRACETEKTNKAANQRKEVLASCRWPRANAFVTLTLQEARMEASDNWEHFREFPWQPTVSTFATNLQWNEYLGWGEGIY